MDVKKFAEDNHNLIYFYLNRYKLDHDEWYDVAAIGYMKAVHSYEAERGSFSNYALQCMRREVGNQMKRDRRNTAYGITVISGDSPISAATDDEGISVFDCIESDFNIEDHIIAEDFKNFLDSQTERRRMVLTYHYEGYSPNEIASMIHTKPANVRMLIRNSYRAYKKFESKNH